MIGTTLSHYKITAKLDREVAIKVLPLEFEKMIFPSAVQQTLCTS